MATIASLLSDNSTNITSKTEAGSITPTIDGAERVKIINELLSRGITVVADTTALQAVSGADFKQAIVENDAVYKWAASGTPNGTTIFAASGGGVWNQVFSGGAGGSSAWGGITGTLSAQTDLQNALNAKQATLVSATNIKTINGSSVLGAGDLVVSGGASAINDLTDVTITTVSSGDSLEYNGSAFVNVNKNFTELTGTTWDGSNKYKTLTASLALTLSGTKTAGLLYIAGNSSYTLSINGTAITINNTGDSIVGFIKQNGVYVITTDLSPLAIGEGADVTAPTVVSATAIDANTIRVVFSESMGAVTIAGHSFKQNGTPITPDSVSGATTTWDFVVSETLLESDTLLRSYNIGTGATTDLAGNELASYTDAAVTNNASGLVDINFTTVTTGFAKTSNYWTGPNIGVYDNYGLSSQLFSGDGYIEWSFEAINGGGSILTLRTDAVNEIFSANNYKAAAIIATGPYNINYIDNGGSVTDTGTAVTAGDFVRISRVGSTIKLQKRTGATITDLHTFAFSSSADLYIQGSTITVSGGTTFRLYAPKGSNLV